MSNQIVHKTENEIKMNSFYMDLIRSKHPIDQSLVDKFKRDQNQIKKENPLYANQVN